MDKSTFSRQKVFIEKLKEILPAEKNLAGLLSEVLNISTDSVYRRLRCETPFSMDDYILLCEHLKISSDLSGGERTTQALFNFTLFENDETRVDKYLANLANTLQQIELTSDKRVYYATEDIPLFYYFIFPELTAFKIFFWKKSIISDNYNTNTYFNVKGETPETIAHCREIFDRYCRVPSIEIYPERTLDSTVRQLEYYWESDMLATEDAKLLLDQLEATAVYLKDIASKSSKLTDSDNKNLEMYVSDLMINTNTIMVEIGSMKSVYKSVNTFNSLSTSHLQYCAETDRWMQNLIRKSTLISGIAERHRMKLFRHALNAIEALRKKVNG